MNRRIKALVFLIVALAIIWPVAKRYYFVICGRVICEQGVDGGRVARIRQYNQSILPGDGYYYALEISWPRRGITPPKVLSSFFLNLDSYTACNVSIKQNKKRIVFVLDSHTYVCVLENFRSCLWWDDPQFLPDLLR